MVKNVQRTEQIFKKNVQRAEQMKQKKANITWGFTLVMFAFGAFYSFHFMARFLAMAKLKQAWLCSSGLTKTFILTQIGH